MNTPTAPEAVVAAGARTATVTRNTAETKITVRVNLDGSGQAEACHRHRLLRPHARPDRPPRPDRPRHRRQGDLHIDGHHTVEDVGITLGQAVAKAVGDKKGIRRYGHAYVPLDEALSRVVIDFSGRPGLGDARALHQRHDRHLRQPAHLRVLPGLRQPRLRDACTSTTCKGVNAHHQCETVFKAFARALRAALELDPRSAGAIPSTKGSL